MMFLIPLLNGISNSLFRGGYIEDWFPNFKGGKIITALLFGLFACIASHNYLYGFMMALAMYPGQTPKVFKVSSDWAKADKDYLAWSWIVFKRSLVWVALPAMVTAIFYHWQALWWLVPLFGMIPSYSVTWTHWRFNKWALSEFIYGVMLAIPLVML